MLSFIEWTAGALAYEIFGQEHPFRNKDKPIDKESYDISDLPELKGYALYVILGSVVHVSFMTMTRV